MTLQGHSLNLHEYFLVQVGFQERIPDFIKLKEPTTDPESHPTWWYHTQQHCHQGDGDNSESVSDPELWAHSQQPTGHFHQMSLGQPKCIKFPKFFNFFYCAIFEKNLIHSMLFIPFMLSSTVKYCPLHNIKPFPYNCWLYQEVRKLKPTDLYSWEKW